MKPPVATNEAVRKTMQGNTKKDTSIELVLRSALWKRGVRFRKNVKSILGTPDIAIKKYHLVVFCDGDFWHGRNFTVDTVNTNKAFWVDKIRTNQERDLRQTIQLRDDGWTVLRFWGSDIKKDSDAIAEQIVDVIQRKRQWKDKCQ